MTHTRSLLVGAVVGSALTMTTMGFVACQKNDKKAQAQQGTGPGASAAVPGQPPEDLAAIVAEIDEVKITVADFQDRINKQSPYIRARYTSLERKKEFLDNLVRFEVLAKEAKRRGYDQDAEVVRTMKQVMIQKLMKDEFDNRVKPEDVTEAEMRAFYDEHKADYNKPEEVRVSAILIKDKATADKVMTEAKGPKGKDNKGFRDLVTQYSIDEDSKLRGGDLRYFAADTTEVPAEVVKVAFTLENTGDVAGPISTPKGFYIIKQTGRRKALAKAFEEVQRQIQNRLYRDKRTKAMEDFVAKLKGAAKITVHDDVLTSKVRVDTSGAAGGPGDEMPGMPHGMGPGGMPGMAPAGPGGAPGGPGVEMPPLQPIPPGPGRGGPPAPGPAPQPANP